MFFLNRIVFSPIAKLAISTSPITSDVLLRIIYVFTHIEFSGRVNRYVTTEIIILKWLLECTWKLISLLPITSEPFLEFNF